MSLLSRLWSVLGLGGSARGLRPALLSPTWLQLPVLAPGGTCALVGEANYQPALERLAGGRHDTGTVVRWITVVIEAEPWNKYDRNAIRVTAQGEVLGYVPRDQTAEFHAMLRGLGGPCTARGRLIGGWDRGPTDRGMIGLELDVRIPFAVMRRDTPFLPAEHEVALVGEEHCTPRRRALGERFGVRLSVEQANPIRPNLPAPVVSAFEDGQCIGWLSPTMALRYQPLIQRVIEAGIVPTAYAVARSGAKAAQITVFLPNAA